MLIQPSLFARQYIPIRPVAVLPRDLLTVIKAARKERNKVRRHWAERLQALQMPLFWNHDPEDRGDVEDLEQGHEPQVFAIGPEVEEPVVWTAEEIVKLASVIIEESLRVLTAKNNPSEKQDVLDWVFESDIVDSIIIHTPGGPRNRIIYASEVPFTFAFCCNVAGHNPDRYRDYIRRLVPEVGQRYVSHANQSELGLDEVRYRAPVF